MPRIELAPEVGQHGYVALYRYVDSLDIVFMLAVRAQREAGFVR
ncbi:MULTISPECIES: hypothetical protein [unclassified Rhodanobacter]|uniref:Plasmid stabilization protein n=1 Tax=Rhodanobacter humi TaxID=1888173 RepID=A0ABV4AKL4_9GAMM